MEKRHEGYMGGLDLGGVETCRRRDRTGWIDQPAPRGYSEGSGADRHPAHLHGRRPTGAGGLPPS